MTLSIIAALASNRVIGVENRLPWHLPADLKHFKSLTMGKPIVMGRKTYESIGKALPGRRNIVISHNSHYLAPECEVVSSLDEALSLFSSDQEVMLIGGAQLFTQALPQADLLYLTLIHHDFVGDCYFPEWDQGQWKEIMRVDCAAHFENPHPYSFLTFQRHSP